MEKLMVNINCAICQSYISLSNTLVKQSINFECIYTVLDTRDKLGIVLV